MGEKTGITWTNGGSTQNFWRGCSKVSEGCKYCYMFRDLAKYGQDGATYIRAAKTTFYKPLKWKEPRMIFTCSLSDFFLQSADVDRPDAWKVIRDTPQHTWLILTKRPERIKECLPDDWGTGYENVWLGVTTENQFRLAQRLPIFAEIPAKLKFLSVEPILSEIDLEDEYISKYLNEIGWIIVGGESGNDNGKHKYRPSEYSWYEKIVEQSRARNIPIFVKQLGTHLGKEISKNVASISDRNGQKIESLPDAIKFREFPNIK